MDNQAQIIADMASKIAELERQLAEKDSEEYTRIAELIGEMAWGIELPTIMNFAVIDPFSKEVTKVAVSGNSQKPYFEAIYQKLKKAPLYQPLIIERQKVRELEIELASKEEFIVKLPEFHVDSEFEPALNFHDVKAAITAAGGRCV